MITIQTAIILISIHLIYYSILQIFSDLLRIGSVKNTPNKIITKLRSQFKVKLLTFQKNNQHYGFAWFKTIYLNENLFNRPKALHFTFYHELFHVQHKHKRNTLLLRLVFSLLPILLLLHWAVFAVTYILGAWILYKYNERCETGANDYARKMIENV